MAERAILVFAKAPEPGLAKTRLIPALGAEGAAALAERLLEHTLEAAASVPEAALELHCAPDCSHPLFRSLAARHRLALQVQAGADLGERMAAALEGALSRHRQVVLIGSDCPLMDAAYLEEAFSMLAGGHDMVLGPAEDGGFVLIGTVVSLPGGLFEGIDWGTDRVLAQTRARIQALGIGHGELPVCWDLDRPADLNRLARAGWDGYNSPVS